MAAIYVSKRVAFIGGTGPRGLTLHVNFSVYVYVVLMSNLKNDHVTCHIH